MSLKVQEGFLVLLPDRREETRLRQEQVRLEQQRREIELTRLQVQELLSQFIC